MNRLKLFLLSLCCLSAVAGRAATVSGTITNAGLSAPSASQKVYLHDSTSTGGMATIDSTFTGTTGAYSFTIPSTTTSGRFGISTVACGRRSFSTFTTYTGANLTKNLSVCVPITISGTVAYLTSFASGIKVYLVDSIPGVGVTYRDSTTATTGGFYTFTVPATVNMYRIYAIGCGSRWNSSFYFQSTGSRTINLTLSCSGAAIYDTLKNSTSGLPVYGQKVYLLDSTATSYRLDSALTNIQGVASFYVPPSVASGTLRIFTYACGLQSQSFAYSSTSMIAPTMLICTSNAIISGTVTNVTTSTPIANQWVSVSDSSGTSLLFSDTVRTNASGFYSTPVPAYVPATGTMIAETWACGIRHSSRGTYTGSNMTLNLSVCATSAATVSGVVYDFATNTGIAGRKVYLVDSSTSTGLVISRDSTVTNASGAYSFAIPPSVSSAYYIISVPSCGGLPIRQFAGYSGFSIVRNFNVCGTTGLATISGTILNKGVPVSGATVTYNSTLTATTSATGTYSITIPANYLLGTFYTLRATSVCSSGSVSVRYTGANITRTDSLKTASCFTISGTVTKQGSGPAASAKVYLIGEFDDTTTTPIIHYLVALDSTTTNSSGQYSFTKSSIYIGIQHIKAALQPSDASYWNFLPTYSDSVLNWNNADTLTVSSWLSNASNVNVSLRGGTNPGGPGFIGGNVLVGANKSTAVGDPLAQRILILTTNTDQPVAYTYSDASGRFSFPSLAYGTYKLFGDAGGKTNPPLTITISAARPGYDNILFEENNTTFRGSVSTGVPGAGPLDGLRVYPNPAVDAIRISGLSAISGSKTLRLSSVTGTMISSQTVVSGDNASFNAAGLPAGIYTLYITTEAGTASYKVVK